MDGTFLGKFVGFRHVRKLGCSKGESHAGTKGWDRLRAVEHGKSLHSSGLGTRGPSVLF